MDDDTAADETLSLMSSLELEEEEERRPLTTNGITDGDSIIRNSKRNPIGQVSTTIFIIIVIILFVLVSIIISYSQQDNIIKVVIRNHPTIWGKSTGSNSSAPDGVTNHHSTNHSGPSMHRPNRMNSTKDNLPSSVTQPSNDGTNTHPPPSSSSSSTPPRSYNPPPMNDEYAFLPWDVTTGDAQPLSQLNSIQMIYQYYTMHSVGALQSQNDMTNRTYSVAFLPCIHININTEEVNEILDDYYTSEILHNFFNTLVWSIITNRTLIVQWYDPTTTTTNNNIHPPLYHIHLKNATEQFYTCSMVNRNPSTASLPLLSLTSWMVQWSDLLQYHPDIIHETIVPIPIDLYRQQYDTIHSVVLFPQINQFHIHSSLSNNKNNDAIFYNPWYNHPLSYTNGIQYVKNLPEWNRHVALELYYEGSDFLYGALFRICFPHYKYFDWMSNHNYHNKNRPGKTIGKKQSNDVVSFALFSVPHSSDDSETSQHNDGDVANASTKVNVDAEIKCLRQILPLSDDPNTCQIVILATNTKVIDHITDWITSSKRQCTVLHSWNQSATLSSPTNDTVEENRQSNANTDDDIPSPKSHSTTTSSINDSGDNNDDASNGDDDQNDDGDDGGGNDDDQESNEDNDDNDPDDDDHGSRKRKSKRRRIGIRKRRQTRGSPNKRDTPTGSVRSSSSSRIRLSDIAWTSNVVRTGMIGHTDHPDFQLLVEWIAYHRQMEYVTRNDDNNKYDRQRRRRFPSVATSAVEESDAIEPLLWCEL